MTDSHPRRVVYVLTDQSDTIEDVLNRGSLSEQMSVSEAKSAQKFNPEGKSGQTSGSENVSAQKSEGENWRPKSPIITGGDSPAPIYDPQQIHTQFPARWQVYIRNNYRNLAHIQQVFNVSERTARKWWNGETGANGGHVAIAVCQHPVAAPRMLFAAE